MDYIGFTEKTTQSILVFLRTQPVVLNKEKWQTHSNFYLSWSDSPTMTLAEFACNLNKHQQKAKKQEVTVDDTDKGIHFLSCT